MKISAAPDMRDEGAYRRAWKIGRCNAGVPAYLFWFDARLGVDCLRVVFRDEHSPISESSPKRSKINRSERDRAFAQSSSGDSLFAAGVAASRGFT